MNCTACGARKRENVDSMVVTYVYHTSKINAVMVNGTEAQVRICGSGGGSGI